MVERRLYLIDAFALIFRAYYGNMRIKNGAAVTMARMLLAIVAQHKPSHLAMVFDLPEPTFRHQIYPEYKANRAEMPEDLRPQVPMIRELTKALNIPIVELAGYEADDVMGTLARQASRAGLPAVIVSPDKDLLQLVDDAGGIQVLNNRDGEAWIDRAGVKERFGVWPEQVVDVLALMGDASDNIKGVEGIGEKGARDLIEQYGSLDAVIAHRSELKRKAHREGLEAALERLPLVRRLVTVVTDLELPLGLDDLAYPGVDPVQARAAFKAMGFEALTKEFTGTGEAGTAAAARTYRAAASLDELAGAVAACRKAGVFGLDTETTSIDPTRGHLVGLSLAWRPNEGLYVPLAHLKPGSSDMEGALPGLLPESGLPEGLLDLRGDPLAFFRELAEHLDPRNLPFKEARELLAPLLADPEVRKAGQNLKYDLQVLERHGLPVRGIGDDSMVLSFLLDSRLRHNLDDLSARHLDLRPIPFESVVGKGKAAKRFDQADFGQAVQYAAEDADLALQLCAKLRPLLAADPALVRLYEQVDLPLVPVLAELELDGVGLDVTVLEGLAREMRIHRDAAGARAVELAGEDFNLNSPTQLGRILYEKMGLPVLKRTDKTKAPATDEDVLSDLAKREDGEIARVLLRHRQLQKLLGTYVEALPGMVNPITGRLHTRLHQAAVATGRLASSDPNLQNIPARTEEGRAIRGAFVPGPGRVFLDADYSQIELRVVAALAGDPVLLGAFARGEDIHRRTASEVLGVPMEAVTGEQRSAAKAVNFGLLYGQGAFALSASLGISFKEAKAFIERYFERMPKVAEWIEGTKARALEEGLVRTFWGRIRRIPDLQSANQGLKAQALREAVNTVVQGTAADIMRRAMVRLHAGLEREGRAARLLLQVHDELLVEAPEAEAPAVSRLLREAMEGADDLGPLGVPLSAEVRRGSSWLECK